MHSTVFVAIPAEKIAGDYSIKNISEIVDSMVEPYYIETAPEGQVQMDGYKIGGRWAGFIGTKPDAKSIIPSSSGKFAYEIADSYDVVVNENKPGPYMLGSLEIVPVDGATKKDIIWDSIGRMQRFVFYTTFKKLFNRDPQMGELDPAYSIKEDGLYLDTDEGPVLMYKKDESFEEQVERLDLSFERLMMFPEAFIDKEGGWHSFGSLLTDPKSFKKLMNEGDPYEAAQNLFMEEFYTYIDNELLPDDYFLVLDCHY